MNLKSKLIRGALALSFVLSISLQAAQKPVMVHYMPWFVSKPYSGTWGYHWTLNSTNCNPDQFSTNGQRKIASHYYPLIGPYDSLDPAVLEYHVLLMKLGGVDGVIADWYGQETFYDYGEINRRTLALFDWARKAGLKFAICYEDRTVQAKVNAGFINATNAVANAQRSMLYLQTNWFNDASYLQFSNSPVLLDFGPIYFKDSSQWASIFSVLSNRPAFFTEDVRLPVGLGAFDWPPMSRSTGGVLSTNSLNGYLNTFEMLGKAWPSYVSSAFPRFHDFYGEVGFSSYGYLDDRNGGTFRETLQRAITNNSAVVQIVTWNDFGEGTVIEPTVEYGYRDLGQVQEMRRRYLDPGFAGTTNDLGMALRFYNMRKQLGTYPAIAAELDRIFSNIVSGKLAAANLQLTGIESNYPVNYDLSVAAGEIQFCVGGYLGSGAQVWMSTNLTDWQTARTFAAGTNLIIFSTSTTNSTRSFFKVR